MILYKGRSVDTTNIVALEVLHSTRLVQEPAIPRNSALIDGKIECS